MLAVARTKAQKIEQLKVDTMKQQIKVGDQPRTCLNSKGGMVGSRRGKASNKGMIGRLKLMPQPWSPWLNLNHDPSCGSKSLKTGKLCLAISFAPMMRAQFLTSCFVRGRKKGRSGTHDMTPKLNSGRTCWRSYPRVNARDF